MSAILNPVPTPPQHSAPEPQIEKPGRPAWVWMVALALIAAAVYGIWNWNVRQREAKQAAAVIPIKIATVSQGVLENRIRVGGITSARDYVNVTTPRLNGPEGGKPLVLLKLLSTGTLVKKGQLIVEIDGQTAQDHIDDVHSTVLQSESDLRKRRAEQAVEWENLLQNVRIAKAELDKLLVDARASEIRTAIDQELIKLSVEEAQAAYKELQEEVKLKKQSQESEMQILDFTRERHTRHRDRHKKDLLKYTITAPMDGMFVVQSIFRGGEFVPIGEGDQVYPGQLVAKVVNPKSMQVEGKINQAESGKFRIGESAEISLDAFPGLKLRGKVYSIGALAVTGGMSQAAYVRTIPIRVMFDELDPRVIPDLSAGADVLIGKQENAAIVPLGAIREEKGKHIAYVKDGGVFVPREVKISARNDIAAAIESGLAPGDEVALNYEVAAVK